jgi:hypothetical protein
MLTSEDAHGAGMPRYREQMLGVLRRSKFEQGVM